MSHYAEVALTAEEEEKQKQIEQDHLLAIQLQNQFGGAAPAQPAQPVRTTPAVVTPPVQQEPRRSRDTSKKDKRKASRSRSSSRSKKEKQDTSGWSVAYIPEEKSEFEGWGFKNVPPAWKC